MKRELSLNQEIINTIRTLSIDAIEAANSGHPGAPMGLAPTGWTLYNNIMKFNPTNPQWVNRDRFVLSAGHASMLIYSILHLTGFDISLNDIKNFRQWGSKCAGHPELGLAPGVETTTGPLGQGAATSVGFAIAEEKLASRFNTKEIKLIDYNSYAVMGDGCMMEGLTSEAASMAGHLGLGKLIWLYDSNNITIEGGTDIAFTEDVAKRFNGYNWEVITINDANDTQALEQALNQAKSETTKPSLIIVKSKIGYGSPNLAGTAEIHGAPLGKQEIVLTKEALGMDPNKSFYISDRIKDNIKVIVNRGIKQEKEWNEIFKAYKIANEQNAKELQSFMDGTLPIDWDKSLPIFKSDEKGIASRSSNGTILNSIASVVPNFFGGSADLGPSNKTVLNDMGWFSKEDRDGRNIHFGVREHAMGAVANGLAISGFRSFCSTFLVFADYMRSSIRLASLMKLPVNFIFTHDSIFVGEDGPTHQPIEHVSSLRIIPNLKVIRPADANELVELWKATMNSGNSPAAFILTRQNIPNYDRSDLAPATMASKGGYILKDCKGSADIILMGSGSEVEICLDAAQKLSSDGVKVRVVSMPCMELFDAQNKEYRESVLPAICNKRIAVEAGVSINWYKYTLSDDENSFLTRDEFGESAPAEVLVEKFGFNKEKLINKAMALLK